MTDIAFEHFDPEIELGNLDENGRPIRPRKKPGRKPNPPSPAQRKAQNRAAQRAFRERKRREMREAEATVKRSLYARDQALRQVAKMKRRIKELEYENNHLRGDLLSLKLACMSHKVDLPSFSDTGMRDELGAEKLMKSSSKTMSQHLEFFLDRNKHIVSVDDEHLPPDLSKSPAFTTLDSPSASSSSSASYNPLDTLLPQILHSQRAMPGSFDIDDMTSQPLPPLDLTQTATVLAPQLHAFNNNNAFQVDPALFEQIASTDLVSSFIDQVTRPNFTIDQTPPELAALVPHEWRSSLQNFSEKEKDEHIPELWNTTEHQVTAAHHQPTVTTSTTSTDKFTIGPDGERVYQPMTPLEFVREMRKIQQTDKKSLAFFEPTELQRNVRHDIRIDAVPGAVMRDQMILFQDYYDANELFNFLIASAMFLGGAPGNQNNWFIPPSFLRKYWFLCPNHKPQRLDNAVEIAVYLSQRMQEMLVIRKQMYFEREKYAEHFPAMIEENEDEDMFGGSPEQEDALLLELQHHDSDHDSNSEDAFFELSDDLPLSKC
ncbi:hypothetical protein BJV82DRAFT_620586 [Fennellomyces sp. T-0311]|nr:hypothetical protein BJV82DRAFT_620586 [Fennellomyces sp. T-0311]